MKEQPPRPSLAFTESGNSRPIYDNYSGEDFLYMHRQMILHVNKELIKLRNPTYPKIVGWNPIPSPDDKDYPVPPAWDTGDPDLYVRLVE